MSDKLMLSMLEALNTEELPVLVETFLKKFPNDGVEGQPFDHLALILLAKFKEAEWISTNLPLNDLKSNILEFKSTGREALNLLKRPSKVESNSLSG